MQSWGRNENREKRSGEKRRNGATETKRKNKKQESNFSVSILHFNALLFTPLHACMCIHVCDELVQMWSEITWRCVFTWEYEYMYIWLCNQTSYTTKKALQRHKLNSTNHYKNYKNSTRKREERHSWPHKEQRTGSEMLRCFLLCHGSQSLPQGSAWMVLRSTIIQHTFNTHSKFCQFISDQH